MLSRRELLKAASGLSVVTLVGRIAQPGMAQSQVPTSPPTIQIAGGTTALATNPYRFPSHANPGCWQVFDIASDLCLAGTDPNGYYGQPGWNMVLTSAPNSAAPTCMITVPTSAQGGAFAFKYDDGNWQSPRDGPYAPSSFHRILQWRVEVT